MHQFHDALVSFAERRGIHMNNLYIVMPAYNEEENISKVIESWYPILKDKSPDSKIVVAPYGSNDRTIPILEELKSEKYPQIDILISDNQYHGPKVISLYKYAIKNGADYIFQTDSDGQTSPLEFESFWNLRNDYDCIIGNRVKRGDGKSRAFVEKIVCILLRIFFGVNVPDANAPFRLMKADILAKYVSKLPDDYNLPNIMITTYLSYYKEKVCFQPISFQNRTAGTNSINFKKIIKIGMNSLGDFYRFKKLMKNEISCDIDQ